METKEAIHDINQSATAFYKWAIGVLLSVVGFFLVMTYSKLSTIDSNVQVLITSDAVNKNKIEGNTNRIQVLENKMDRVQDELKDLQTKKP